MIRAQIHLPSIAPDHRATFRAPAGFAIHGCRTGAHGRAMLAFIVASATGMGLGQGLTPARRGRIQSDRRGDARPRCLVLIGVIRLIASSTF